MEFSIKNGNPEKQRSDCLIVGVYEGKKLSTPAQLLDDVSQQAITAVIKAGDMQGKLASSALLHQLPGILAKRVLLIGLGKQVEFGQTEYLKAVRAAIKALPEAVESVGFYMAELITAEMTLHQKTTQIAEIVSDATYQINALKSKQPEAKGLRRLLYMLKKKMRKRQKSLWRKGLQLQRVSSWQKTSVTCQGIFVLQAI